MEVIKRYKGFTLIELMITVALAGIILTFAVPGFQGIVRDNRLATQTNEFVGALALARSESIKRGISVTVCKSSTQAGCTSGSNWEQGWIVFSDLDGDGAVDAGTGNCLATEDCILRVSSGLDGSNTLRNNDNRITFNASGFSPGFNGTFSLCDDRGVSKARFIVISNTGRFRIRSQENGDTCP